MKSLLGFLHFHLGHRAGFGAGLILIVALIGIVALLFSLGGGRDGKGSG
jgi:hypothetical protein